MRIDRYLKMSRIIKRRTVAQQACDAGRVWVNDKIVKPGDKVQKEDIITVQFGESQRKYQVLETDERVLKQGKETVFVQLEES